MNMFLPWFEGSDHWHWCASCAAASCFTILLRKRGIIQETFNFKVEGLVEDVGSHLCDLVYECDTEMMRFASVGE